MRILLRLFAVLIALVGVWLFAGFGWALLRLPFTLGLMLAFLVSAALAVLWVRTGIWLWSNRPFWRERKRAAEVATAGTAFLTIALVAQFEKNVDGPLQTAIQLFALGLVVGGYFVFLRIIPETANPSKAPFNPEASTSL